MSRETQTHSWNCLSERCRAEPTYFLGFTFHLFHSAGWMKVFCLCDEGCSLPGLLISEAVLISLQTWKDRRMQLVRQRAED